MGTDINIYAEINVNNKWQPIPEPKATRWSNGKVMPVEAVTCGRDYELYSILVGVTGGLDWKTRYAVVNPIAYPRGMPEDLNDFYKESLAEDFDPEYGSFVHSWLVVQEIIDYDWDNQFVSYRAYVNSKYASLFKDDEDFPYNKFPSEEKLDFTFDYCLEEYESQPEIQLVSWRTSYRDYVESSEVFIDKLLKLGDPELVRIVFWLDA